MGKDSSEGPFRDRKLVWNKFYELKFFYKNLTDIDDPPIRSEEKIGKSDAFRFRVSALLGAGYAIQSFFDNHEQIEPDLFPEESLQLDLHKFLMKQRHITVHIEKPSRNEAEVIQGLTREIVRVDGEFHFKTDNMGEELIQYFKKGAVGPLSSVPVTEVLGVYVAFLEERLEDWKSPPEEIGITAIKENWDV